MPVDLRAISEIVSPAVGNQVYVVGECYRRCERKEKKSEGTEQFHTHPRDGEGCYATLGPVPPDSKGSRGWRGDQNPKLGMPATRELRPMASPLIQSFVQAVTASFASLATTSAQRTSGQSCARDPRRCGDGISATTHAPNPAVRRSTSAGGRVGIRRWRGGR